MYDLIYHDQFVTLIFKTCIIFLSLKTTVSEVPGYLKLLFAFSTAITYSGLYPCPYGDFFYKSELI